MTTVVPDDPDLWQKLIIPEVDIRIISYIVRAFEAKMSSQRCKIQRVRAEPLSRSNPKSHRSCCLKRHGGVNDAPQQRECLRPEKEKSDRKKVTQRLSGLQDAQLFVSLRLLCIFVINQLPNSLSGSLLLTTKCPRIDAFLIMVTRIMVVPLKVSHLVNSKISRIVSQIPVPRSLVTYQLDVPFQIFL